MKRILFILHLPPPVHGSSTVGDQVRKSQTSTDLCETDFINLNTSRTSAAIGKLDCSKLFLYLSILLKTFFSLLFRRPQLVYLAITVNGGGFYKDLGVVALVKLFRVPIIYHLHNKGVATKRDKIPYRWFYPIVFRRSRVILLSKHLYSDIKDYVPENMVDYCPNGMQDEAHGFKRNFEQNSAPVVLFLSNLIESKGVYVLLEACSRLKKRGFDFSVQFVGAEGDVSRAQFNQKIVSLDLSDRVAFLGRKYGEEKHNAFKKADIFAFPTFYHNETFGLVNLEAMMWRLPVVATHEGGIPDVVADGETGILVKQRNVGGLEDALAKLIEDRRLRKRMGEFGREKYERDFTLDTFERRLGGILFNALDEAETR